MSLAVFDVAEVILLDCGNEDWDRADTRRRTGDDCDPSEVHKFDCASDSQVASFAHRPGSLISGRRVLAILNYVRRVPIQSLLANKQCKICSIPRRRERLRFHCVFTVVCVKRMNFLRKYPQRVGKMQWSFFAVKSAKLKSDRRGSDTNHLIEPRSGVLIRLR